MSTMTGFAPMAMETRQPVALGMQRLWLTGRVLAMGARLWVRHEFVSQEKKPLEVIYSFGLPRDAALRRFRVSGTDFQVDSELRPTKEAAKIYEEGIAQGSLATMVRQYGDGIINLNVGNIRPEERVTVLLELLAGVELHDESLRLRFPFTLAPSYHRQARGIEIAPGRFEMELPEEEFDDLILPQFVENATELHQVGFCLDVRMAGAIEEISSPSHAVRVQTGGSGSGRVMLSREGDIPNRDVVLDVKCKAEGARVFGGVDAGKGQFAAVVPSSEFGKLEASARRVVILLDRSGSMQGTPIAQAKRAIEACLGALDAEDQFGIVAFSNDAEAFREELCAGGMKEREKGQEFLKRVEANGGTELAKGVEAAAKQLRNEPGDVFIITDGQVFGTETILERARATGMRIHCLGIGSASQDRFLSQLASHTGGTSRFLTPNERVDLPVLELFASVGRPVVKQVTVKLDGDVEGRISPAPSAYVFSGTPLMLMGECGRGDSVGVKIGWQGAGGEGQLDLTIPMSDAGLGGTLKLLRGSRILSDLESRIPRGFGRGAGAEARREGERARERVAEVSREYQLASSEMSLVAVVKRTGDVAGEIPKTRVVAVGVPDELVMSAVVGAMAMPQIAPRGVASRGLFSATATGAFETAAEFAEELRGIPSGVSSRLRKLLQRNSEPADEAAAPAVSAEDVLVGLAAKVEPDGGMPGKTVEERIAKSLVALLCFVAQGNSSHSGAFRMHVAKLQQFLSAERLKQLDAASADRAARTLEAIRKGQTPKGGWLEAGKKLAGKDAIDVNEIWRQLGESLEEL